LNNLKNIRNRVQNCANLYIVKPFKSNISITRTLLHKR